MTEHTPGPWTLEQDDSVWVALVARERKLAYIFPDPHGPNTTSIGAANARLIANSPDLLAALEALLNETDDVGLAHDESGYEPHAAQQARAAIAKTRGQ